jgi:Zn-finger nucleic acid-binding protein
MIFLGSKFCPHCGGRVTRQEEGGDEGKKCPRCRETLQQVEVGKLRLDECPKCSGLWVDVGTLAVICENAGEQSAVLQVAEAAPAPAVGDAPIRYVPCPACAKLMNRVNFAGISGVIVDVCKPHGTWFDADELRHIVEFIRTGGLEKAKRRSLDELAARERTLHAVMSGGPVEVPASGGMIHAPDLVDFLGSAGGAIIRHLLR